MKKHLITLCLACVALSTQAADDTAIRRNQVGYAPNQETVIVVDGINPAGKLRVTTPTGKVLKPKVKRKALSPWSGKVRYIVDLGPQATTGNYHVAMGHDQCDIKVTERPYHDIATASLRLFCSDAIPTG